MPGSPAQQKSWKADAMKYGSLKLTHTPFLLLTLAGAVLCPIANAVSCKTQSQMAAAERDALSSAARGMVSDVLTGNVEALRAQTLPAIAADFSGIAASVGALKPIVQGATITIDNLYALDASDETAGATSADFYCGTPVVVLNFTNLPPGSYALAIVHATGVAGPQQISLILSQSPDHRWMLGGFFSRPMTEAGHDGLWYWVSARKFAQKNMNWDAWLYYGIAAYFLNPADFLSSPNLEKLQKEQGQVKPTNVPAPEQPMAISGQGSVFQVTTMGPTTTFGPLDLEIEYAPDPNQAAQLHDLPAARKQAAQVMTAVLALHPELRDAFHGMWVHVDQGSVSLVSLELPMEQIASGAQPTAIGSNPTPR
jgi:hypothetical protein